MGKDASLNIRDRIIELRRVRAGDLIPNEHNFRTHPDSQVNAMRGVLAEIGYAGASLARLADDGSLILIDGHLRRDIAPDAIVPVLVTDLNETEADYVLATYDPLAAMATVDNDRLASLLESVKTDDNAVRGLLDALRDEHLVTFVAGKTDPDAVPVVTEPISKPGDLWLPGEHRLACADSTKADDVARLMGGGMAALLWTDPPYGVSYVGKTRDALVLANDGEDGLPALLRATWANVGPVCADNAPFYVARPAGRQAADFMASVIDAGWQFHEELQWVKDSMVLGHSDYHLKHETIMYGWLPGPGRSGRGHHAGSRWFGGNAETSVFEIPRPKASPEHPTGKPVELVERQVGNSSVTGDVVLDPFLGSGTTLIACERLARRCYAMEIEPRYVDVAVRRWSAYTGREATLAATGATFAATAAQRATEASTP